MITYIHDYIHDYIHIYMYIYIYKKGKIILTDLIR